MHKRLQQVPPDKFSAYFTVWLWISYPHFRVAGAALIMQYDSCDARQMSDQVRRVVVFKNLTPLSLKSEYHTESF